MITRNHRQESLCRAYAQAVAGRAGLAVTVPSPDYGIDMGLRFVEEQGQVRFDAGVQLDLQLRSTTRAPVSETHVSFDLDVRTYDSLRGTPPVPRILVVLLLPEDEDQWLSQTQDELVLRHCAYWISLRGAAAISATSSVRVPIPRAQVFSAQAAQDIVDRLRRGEFP